MINDLIGNRIKLEDKIKYLNRQTIRNIILDSKLSNPELKQLDTPETLYIIADEKWIHTQNNNNEDVMVKSIVTFDGIKDKPRRTLNNKRIFASFKGNQFLDDTLDYLYYSYDLDKAIPVDLLENLGIIYLDETQENEFLLPPFKSFCLNLEFNGLFSAVGIAGRGFVC